MNNLGSHQWATGDFQNCPIILDYVPVYTEIATHFLSFKKQYSLSDYCIFPLFDRNFYYDKHIYNLTGSWSVH